MSLQQDILSLFHEQLQSWPLAAKNYEALENIRVKAFDFGAYTINVQFNPARAVSSLAKLDTKTIEARPCFLCAANRPTEQKGIDFKGKYDVLVNPFPICQKHLTIASNIHEPQLISPEKLDDMLDLSEALPDFVILYNGPQSGASAPDHFHFQAGNVDFFHQPVDMFHDGLIDKRVFSSPRKETIAQAFWQLYKELQTNNDEPKMNIFCQFKDNEFVLTVYPRKQHRPRQFFAEGIAQLMVSPGAIDMTGTLIIAREEDFEKITKDDIKDIFKQVSL